jgi:curli biogenesis system outer membrane secretion channel CsgG
VARPTAAQRELIALPAPAQRLTVAVYNFQDQTGQFRGGESTQSLSRVVSQGATSMLVKALQDAGNRAWFQVMERERLDNLLKERQIIREMRQRYLGEEQINPEALPSLMFAGLLLEGGVIGYDTNTMSGGAGARYLGIGASTEYRQDTVTVYLRAVSVKTGEVLTTVVAKKTIASIGVSASAFRYVAFRELLEAETGIKPTAAMLKQLEAIGVRVVTGRQVTEVTDSGIATAGGERAETEERQACRTEAAFQQAAALGVSQPLLDEIADVCVVGRIGDDVVILHLDDPP